MKLLSRVVLSIAIMVLFSSAEQAQADPVIVLNPQLSCSDLRADLAFYRKNIQETCPGIFNKYEGQNIYFPIVDLQGNEVGGLEVHELCELSCQNYIDSYNEMVARGCDMRFNRSIPSQCK